MKIILVVKTNTIMTRILNQSKTNFVEDLEKDENIL